MNNQEAFDKVWQHFLVEKNPPGYNVEQGLCHYVTETGARCAIGCLVSPEEARKLEDASEEKGGAAFSGLIDNDLLPESLQDLDRDLGSALQVAHDDAADTASFRPTLENRLRQLALDYNLEVPK